MVPCYINYQTNLNGHYLTLIFMLYQCICMFKKITLKKIKIGLKFTWGGSENFRCRLKLYTFFLHSSLIDRNTFNNNYKMSY